MNFSTFLKTHEAKIGPVFIIIAAIMWATGGIIRAGVQDFTNPDMFISPIPLVFWEHVFGLVVLIPFIIWKRRDFGRMTSGQWIAAALIGLLASTLGSIFFVSGLSLVFFAPLSSVVLMQQLQPITALTSARFILKEKLPPYFILLATIAMSGSYLMTFPNPLNPLGSASFTDSTIAMAGFFGLLASICWGLGTTLGRVFLKNISFWTGTSLRFGFGTIFAGIALLVIWNTMPIEGFDSVWGTAGTSLNDGQLQLMLTGILATGVGAMLVYYFGLKRTQAKVATIAELAWPVTVFAYDIATGKTFTPVQIAGMMLVVGAMTTVGVLNARRSLTKETA